MILTAIGHENIRAWSSFSAFFAAGCQMEQTPALNPSFFAPRTTWSMKSQPFRALLHLFQNICLTVL
jgi:hypothetical protein